MNKNRLEAFSDGVLAIIITIMVLELKVPHGDQFEHLSGLKSIFISYVLSFIYIAIYWNNHHHLFQAVKHVNGQILWANIHLLFWLSLLPFATTWLGENHFTSLPCALYGFILLMAGLAYYILSQTIIKHHGKDSILAKAIGNDFKGKISLVAYLIAVLVTYWFSVIAFVLYTLVAFMWLVPDTRIEKIIYTDK